MPRFVSELILLVRRSRKLFPKIPLCQKKPSEQAQNFSTNLRLIESENFIFYFQYGLGIRKFIKIKKLYLIMEFFRRNKTFRTILLIGAVFFITKTALRQVRPDVVNYLKPRLEQSIQPYVNKHLDEIMKEQEEKLGLKYSEKPTIAYTLPEQYQAIENVNPRFAACYDIADNTIYISTHHKITPEITLNNLLAKIFASDVFLDVKKVVQHELGHYYADKLNEEQSRGNWPTFKRAPENLEELEARIRTELISEGIAEYFKNKTRNEEPQIEHWYSNPYAMLEPVITYTQGYCLVKPVIELYKRKGIEYLMMNPPRVDELKNPVDYPLRMIREIRRSAYNQEPL